MSEKNRDDKNRWRNESVQAEAIVDRYAHTSFWIEMGSMNIREYCAKHKI